MSVSHHWQEWHLTPRGWEQGSRHRDSATETVPIPADRVLTGTYQRIETDKAIIESADISWTSEKDEHIASLTKRYGSCPERFADSG